jgi:hypothetical protein
LLLAGERFMDSKPRHQCLIYEKSPADYLQVLAGSVIANLKANQRCLYLNSPTMVAGMRCSLAAEGLDLSSEIEKGALILTSDQSHLSEGMFDVGRMLDLLKNAVQQALTDGYAGLWASGDITWELGGETNLDKLFDYEQRLDDFMQNNSSLSGVCQYDGKTLPLHAVETASRTHPEIYINETLSYLNPKYKSQIA